MTFKHLAVPLVCSGLLVGCGGGGGGGSDASDTPQKPSAYVTLDQSSVMVDEGGEATVSLSYDASSEVSVSASDEAVSASIEGETLTLSTSEVDRPVMVTVSITSLLGDDEATESLSLYVRNASAEPLVTKIDDLLDERDNLLNLADDYRLYEFFVDFAYLGGVISYGDKATRLSQFDADAADSYAPLELQIAALATADRDYEQGNISDSTLQMELEQTESLLFDHAAYGKARLVEISEFSQVIVPGFVPATLSYDPQSGLYSRFLSNDEFGTYSNGDYQFSETFAALSSLVRRTPTDSALCEGV